MDQIDTFASRVITLRKRRGLTKSALSRAVGVTTTCVWNWEEGNTHPRAEALTSLARALSTTETYLERGVADTEKTDVATDSALPITANVSEVIMGARQKIAAATGLRVDQVKVVLQYGG